jgi:excisionase family DNA binding protein
MPTYTRPETRDLFSDWTSIEDAALILKRDNSTIRKWANRGDIESIKIGRKVRLVRLSEVQAYSEKFPARSEKLDRRAESA